MSFVDKDKLNGILIELIKPKIMKFLFIVDITFKMLFFVIGYGLVIGSFIALFALPWIMTYQ